VERAKSKPVQLDMHLFVSISVHSWFKLHHKQAIQFESLPG